MVVRAARRIRPKGMQFFEDFPKRSLDRRKENIPELIKKRKQGEKVFLIKDRLVEYDETSRSLRPNYFVVVCYFSFRS